MKKIAIKFIVLKMKKFYSSGYVLVISNVLLILGVAFFGWDVVDIFLIYWAEIAVIGLYNIIKICFVKLEGFEEYPRLGIIRNGIIKIFYSSIFAFHFGAMTFLAGATLYVVISVFNLSHYDPYQLIMRDWPGIIFLFASHGYSFVKNYYLGQEYKKVTIKRLMNQPYIRLLGLVFVLAIGALFGALIFLYYRPSMLYLAVFVLLKIIMDIISHVHERKKFMYTITN